LHSVVSISSDPYVSLHNPGYACICSLVMAEVRILQPAADVCIESQRLTLPQLSPDPLCCLAGGGW
jgi:hypothetical protein